MRLALLPIAMPLVLAACAAGPKAEDHAAHHPPGAATASAGVPAPGQMDAMMKSMQEMRDRMKAAKTPDERAVLMKDHMKLMHDGMAMMGRMRGGMGGRGMAMSPEMMGRRMDMMELMMQMMMDREASKSPGP